MTFELLCLDAGNTVVFLDHARMAKIIGADPERLIVAEGKMKRRLESGEIVNVAWSGAELPGWGQWGRTVATMLDELRMTTDVVRHLESLKAAHVELNLWSNVPEGLREALLDLRRTGVKVCIVSNSEGTLATLLDRLGILDAFDFVLDSGIIGIEKPDPGIFRIALERAKATPERTLHVGDVYAMDVVGARGAGIHPALIDPFGHYAGAHPDVPRIESVASLAKELVVAPAPTYLRMTAKKVQS